MSTGCSHVKGRELSNWFEGLASKYPAEKAKAAGKSKKTAPVGA